MIGYKRLLLLENDPGQVQLIEQILSGAGFEVSVFSDYEYLLSNSHQLKDSFDLAVCNPYLTGELVAPEVVRAIIRDIRVPILLSISFDRSVPPESFNRRGVFGILKFPIDPEVILFNINQAITCFELRKELELLLGTSKNLFKVVSHDLKGPIGMIERTTEVLDKNYENLSREEIHEFIKEINKSSAFSYKFAETLLKWAEENFDADKTKPVNINLYQFIRIIKNYLTPLIREKKVKIINNVPKDTEVYCDQHMLSIVLNNVLGNAVKFSKPGEKVYLTASTVNDLVEISVRDGGVGIHPEDLQLVFSTSFTRKGTCQERGTGFGLLICKELVEKNCGSIGIVSEINEGTVVKIKLPAERSLSK